MELNQLYQELILDHGRRPRHFGSLVNATHHQEAFNPLCGDHFHLHLLVDHRIIRDASFEGTGCAISTASASLMLESAIGMTIDSFEDLFKGIQALLVNQQQDPDLVQRLGKLAALSGVNRFPMRVKCATLAWHGCMSALNEASNCSYTEGGQHE